MSDRDIIELLSKISKEANSTYNKPKELEVEDIKIPSPILQKNNMLILKLVSQIQESYKSFQINKTTLAKLLISEYKQEDIASSKLHFENEEFKQDLKSKIISMNDDFTLLSTTKEQDNLYYKDNFSIKENKLMLELEKMWEQDVRNLPFKTMIQKWKINIPDNVLMFDKSYVRFRKIKSKNILEYVTKDDEIFNVVFSY